MIDIKNKLHYNSLQKQHIKYRIRIQKIAKRRLKTLSDLRRFMADIINQYNNDQIDDIKALKIAYMANILEGIIHTEREDEIIERIETIEKALQ